jgi:hypothetical protein
MGGACGKVKPGQAIGLEVFLGELAEYLDLAQQGGVEGLGAVAGVEALGSALGVGWPRAHSHRVEAIQEAAVSLFRARLSDATSFACSHKSTRLGNAEQRADQCQA